MGKRLLDAAREAAIPGSPEAEALHGTSPSLDAIRRGVKALLKYFKSTGKACPGPHGLILLRWTDRLGRQERGVGAYTPSARLSTCPVLLPPPGLVVSERLVQCGVSRDEFEVN